MTLKLRLVVTVFLLFLITFNLYPQKKTNVLIPEVPYDSTANFLGLNAAQYTGQELWLKRMPESQRELGYANFVLNYKKTADINDPKNVYRCCDGYNSKYYELENKHFLVEQVFKEKMYDEEKIFLKLKELSTGDNLYYLYDPTTHYSFPFIVMGYLEKQKELMKGSEYVFSESVLLNSVNYDSHKPVKSVIGEKWKFVDLGVDYYHFELSVIAQQSAGKTRIAVPLTDILSEELPRKVYSWKAAKEMESKFGIYNYKRILQQKVATNMNKESLQLSWGEPLEIVKDGNTEEWIYASGSVTFRGNDIVKIK